MDNIKLYEIDPAYVQFLSGYAAHLFHNKQPGQSNERKYIGVILTVNGMDYFAPLSSFKDKHSRMQESVDFIKVKRYAVININNMFPVPDGLATYVDISKEKMSATDHCYWPSTVRSKACRRKSGRMRKSSISIGLKMAHQLLLENAVMISNCLKKPVATIKRSEYLDAGFLV